MKTRAQKDIYNSLFIAALFTIAKKNGNNQSVTHTHNGNYSTIKKERNSDICDNTDGHWRHYATRNKSDRERQRMNSYVEPKKQLNSQVMSQESISSLGDLL